MPLDTACKSCYPNYMKPNQDHPLYKYILEMRDNRKSYQEIANHFCLTRQRIHQITGGGKLQKIEKQPKKTKKTPQQEFWDSVDIKTDSECWEWKKSKSLLGYGRWRKNTYCHRVAWIFTFGEIEDGMHVCHHCDNPSCCNPSHLFLGTHMDNMHDRDAKGRNTGGINNKGKKYKKNKKTQTDKCIHGHIYSNENTSIYNGLRQCKACNRDQHKERYHRLKNKESEQ